jgi:hypothetical protein
MSRILSEERKKGNKLRKKILERDDYKCRLCGSTEDLEVHHMQALVYGGKSEEKNLITLCAECHRYAPEDGVEANERYLNERNKVIYEQVVKMPESYAMITVAYLEFLKSRINTYVELGFIDQQQANFIMIFETNKII